MRSKVYLRRSFFFNSNQGIQAIKRNVINSFEGIDTKKANISSNEYAKRLRTETLAKRLGTPNLYNTQSNMGN